MKQILLLDEINFLFVSKSKYDYLLTYDSYVPVHNRFHRGEWITWDSGGEGALDTPGPLNSIERRTLVVYTSPHSLSLALSLLSMASIVPDEEVFSQFTEKSKQQYRRIWAHFRYFVMDVDFETGPPGEESFTIFFNFLRQEKKYASTTMSYVVFMYHF
jgi:hypothetical protein